MIWLMANQKTSQKELNQAKSHKVKNLKLRVIQKMMVIRKDQLQWFTSFLIKNLAEVVLTLNQIINSQMNFIGRLLKKLKCHCFCMFLCFKLTHQLQTQLFFLISHYLVSYFLDFHWHSSDFLSSLHIFFYLIIAVNSS